MTSITALDYPYRYYNKDIKPGRPQLFYAIYTCELFWKRDLPYRINEGKSMDRLSEFENYRVRMNNRIAEIDHLGIKRFFNLDTAAYKDGELPGKTKELLGLASSMVLRCNDCIDYHILQCVDAGWSDAELMEVFNVALVVGGSIVIPHLRHAVETLDMIRQRSKGEE